MNEKCYTFKYQNLENRLSCIFQALGNILLQRYRASMTKHRQQSTKVKAKGIDLIESGLFFSVEKGHEAISKETQITKDFC